MTDETTTVEAGLKSALSSDVSNNAICTLADEKRTCPALLPREVPGASLPAQSASDGFARSATVSCEPARLRSGLVCARPNLSRPRVAIRSSLQPRRTEISCRLTVEIRTVLPLSQGRRGSP